MTWRTEVEMDMNLQIEMVENLNEWGRIQQFNKCLKKRPQCLVVIVISLKHVCQNMIKTSKTPCIRLTSKIQRCMQ